MDTSVKRTVEKVVKSLNKRRRRKGRTNHI